jgi:hypothetical protein
MELTVPEDYEPESIVLLGAICMGGVVPTAIDPMGSVEDIRPCAEEAGVGDIVAATVTVQQRPEFRNLRPGLMSLTLDGVELTEEVVDAGEPCADGSLPEVSLDQETEIVLRPVPGSRETYIEQLEMEEAVEDLQNSLFVSEGSLSRQYTFVDDGTPEPSVEYLAEADPDDPLPAEGRTVKLIVVMRDRRGGEDILRRGFCLVP